MSAFECDDQLGDGTTSAGTSDGSAGIQGTHTYAEEGTYAGSVSYTYPLATRVCPSGTQTASFEATVQDGALDGTGRDVAGTAGQSVSGVVAHFSDANPAAGAGDFSAQITWGDGSTTAGTITAAAGGGFDVTGTHTYVSAGNAYPVNTTVADVGGASTSATSFAQIAQAPDPPPRIVEAPVVSGPAHETDVLTTTNGLWSGSPTSFQYQWLRCATPSGGRCAVIAGATATTYRLVHADVGYTMRSRVLASNAVGSSSADSDPTAAVTPLVLTASFTVTPNPFCTGNRVIYDATGSLAPNSPIERYRFTEDASFTPYDENLPADAGSLHTPSPAPWIISDGPSPRASEIPTYDVRWYLDLPLEMPLRFDGAWQGSPRTVTLTVWDRSGAKASSTQVLPLAVYPDGFELSGPYASSRTRCPPSAPQGVRGDFLLRDVKLAVSHQALSAKIRCPTLTDCIGWLQIDHAFSRRRRHGKPVVIASGSFYVVGHRSATITAKLTPAGRSLLKRGKPLLVSVRLTTVSPSGRTIRQSHAVTLPGYTRRR